ncbi:Reticulon-like protein B11 [Nymphaea thermarum]|nr:Reticulon-like protein B11 [Nymphaea thermarum]
MSLVRDVNSFATWSSLLSRPPFQLPLELLPPFLLHLPVFAVDIHSVSLLTKLGAFLTTSVMGCHHADKDLGFDSLHLWRRRNVCIMILVATSTLLLLFDMAGYDFLSFISNVTLLFVLIFFGASDREGSTTT